MGKIRKPAAKSVIEAVVRRDFRRRTLPAALDFMNEHDLRLREHGFARTPGNKLVGVSLRKRPDGLDTRDLRLGEKLFLHVHPDTMAEMSLSDIANTVEQIQTQGNMGHVTAAVDTRAAMHHLETTLRPVHYQIASDMILNGREGWKPTAGQKKAAKKAVREAAKLIEVWGTVHVRPTKRLLQMPKAKIDDLLGYLKPMAEKEREFLKIEGRANELMTLQREAKKEIFERHGEIFRIRRVPMSGYIYNTKTEEFERADGTKPRTGWTVLHNS